MKPSSNFTSRIDPDHVTTPIDFMKLSFLMIVVYNGQLDRVTGAEQNDVTRLRQESFRIYRSQLGFIGVIQDLQESVRFLGVIQDSQESLRIHRSHLGFQESIRIFRSQLGFQESVRIFQDSGFYFQDFFRIQNFFLGIIQDLFLILSRIYFQFIQDLFLFYLGFLIYLGFYF